jgi:signal transduction histidine kinase
MIVIVKQPRAQSRLDGLFWSKSVAVLIAIQLVFWIFSAAGERSVRPDNMPSRPWVEYQLLSENGKVEDSGAKQRAYYQNNPIYKAPIGRGSPRAVFNIPFEFDRALPEHAFYLAGTPGLQEIRLNGSVIQPNVPLDTQRGASDGGTVYYLLPKNLLKPSGNEIQVFVETQSSVLPLAAFSITGPENAATAVKWSNLFGSSLAIVTASFLFFAVLLCAIVNWPPQDKRRIRSLMLLMAIWMTRTYFVTFQTPFEVPFLITYCIYYVLEISSLMAIARYIVIDGELGRAQARAVSWLWCILIFCSILSPLYGFFVGPTAQKTMSYLPWSIAIVTVPLLIWGLIQLSRSVITIADGHWIEKIAIMFCLTAQSIDTLDSAFQLSVVFNPDLPLTFYKTVPFGLLLGLGVVASIAREASEARRTVLQSNEILAAKLTEQNAELARSYDAQKQMLGRQVMLEERQRIVRDMHDGIGGQLLGLMMQVRSGGVEKKQVEEGLQSSIADLRLIVDSMDTADEGLAETLRSFEHRVRAQVEAAGMAFKADHGLDDSTPGPGPRPTLQILRILQEGVTNAMRHSGGNEIALASEKDAEGLIRISITDNGKGMPEDIKGGRGLTSMRSRAEAVGGTLDIQSGDAGTVLLLTLPQSD